MSQDDKKNLSDAVDISGTIYHMIVIYGALVSNDDISRVFCSFFQNFDSLCCQEGQRAKNGPKWQKNCLTLYLMNCTSHDCGFWHRCVKWWYLQHLFFQFLNWKLNFRKVFAGGQVRNFSSFSMVMCCKCLEHSIVFPVDLFWSNLHLIFLHIPFSWNSWVWSFFSSILGIEAFFFGRF